MGAKSHMFLRMPIFFQGVGLRQVELERVLLQDLGDAAVVGLQLQLELVQLQVELAQVAIDQAVALLRVQDLLVRLFDHLSKVVQWLLELCHKFGIPI